MTGPASVRFIDYYSFARIRKQVAIIIVLLLLNKLGVAGNLIFYSILFAWSFRGPDWAIKALSMSGFLITASGFFVSLSSFVGILKYLLLLVAGIIIVRSANNPFGKTFLRLLLLFGGVAALLTLYNGYFVPVSLLKAASFTYGAFCLLSIVQIRRNISSDMLEWAFSLSLVVVVMSYGALAIGVGYGEFETIWGGRFTGYRGVFTHPQTMGVIACLFSVFLSTMLLFIDFPHRKLAIVLLGALLYLVYLSGARTGVLGYILTMGTTLFLVGMQRSAPQETKRLRRYQAQFFGFVLTGLVVLMLIDLFSGAVTNRATEFLVKGKTYDNFNAQVLLSARQDQINRAWETFKESPMTGIGFGTDLSPHWQAKATLLSASTEKGFLPTALLEEVGIIGATCFVFFVMSLLLFTITSRRYLGMAMLIGFLVVNLGEMMFFAFGGMAMFCWPLLAMCMTVSNTRLHSINTVRRA